MHQLWKARVATVEVSELGDAGMGRRSQRSGAGARRVKSSPRLCSAALHLNSRPPLCPSNFKVLDPDLKPGCAEACTDAGIVNRVEEKHESVL